MPTQAERDFGISALVVDQRRAETLLAQVASALRSVPIDGPTLALHLRALSLKRAVMRWAEEQPEELVRRAVLDEVVGMQGEAREWRRLNTPCSARMRG